MSSKTRVIVPLGLHQIFAWGSSYYLLTVLAAPIARDTGWSLAWITAGFSIGLISSSLISPSAARAIVRFGGARVLAFGSALLSLGLAGLAFAPSLPFYILSWTVFGAGMGCALYDAAFSTLGQLYGAEARRPITTLTLFGGFASTVCWPLSAYLVETFGWRETCLFYAAIHLFVSVPVLLLLLPRKTGNGKPDTKAKAPEGHRRNLLLLTLIFVTGSAIFSIMSIHLITLLQSLGLALAASVALGTLVGPSQVGARVVEIVLGSRYHPVWTLVTSATLICCGIILLTFGFPITAACLVLYGAGNGIWSISRGTVPLALFGAEDFPAIMGRLAKAAFLAQAVAPFAAAQIIQLSGEQSALAAIAALSVLNLGLVLLLRVRSRGQAL
ncbi:MFS transporter [Terrihabitans soli]|uniref:MFS transporter n=1 Tax=Terrihabitans soli TaxID=708113 RepID=A0A6S6QT28_9HYPH|nr:MFS transporter [Terrihabitans soli]BCJ91117.1 MFS transporter [Terrihabitans soli]